MIMNPSFSSSFERTGRQLGLVALVWALAVVVASWSGTLAALPLPAIAALVAAGILLPTGAYYLSQRLQQWVARQGHRRLVLLHTWRVPAALVFFAYGAAGELPPLFWLLAGTGDFIAGVLAWHTARRPLTMAALRRFHAFGFADFVVAVGTGLSFTLLQDPRMIALTTLPMALIPLFGVGLSGAAHIVAFDRMRRERLQPAAAGELAVG
jgi:hypothetical protein